MATQVISQLDLNKLPLLNVAIEPVETSDDLFSSTYPAASNANRLLMVHHSDNSFELGGADNEGGGVGFYYCDGENWFRVPLQSEITSQISNAITSSINTLNPVVGATISGKTLTLTFKNGSKKAFDASYAAATQSAAGLMSAADKTKLDGIETNANKITVDSALSPTSTNPVQNKAINSALALKVSNSLTVNGHALTGNITLSKTDLGLGNVTNDAAIPLSQKGAANGVATLDSAGKVPTSQLPSYVDDVLELSGVVSGTTYSGLTAGKLYYNTTSKQILTATSATAGTLSTPETGKIYAYIGTSGSGFYTDRIYRWSGSAMVEISSSPDVAGSNVTISTPTASSTVPAAGTKTVLNWITSLAQNIVYLLGNFVIKTRKVSAGTGLSGGGTLEADRTISHQAKPTSGSDAGGSGNYVTGVTIDSLGHVVSTTKASLPTYTSVKVYTSGALTGTSGTIEKATHNISVIGSVQAFMGNKQVICDITLNSDGSVSWASGVALTSGSNFIIKIMGC